MNKCLSLLALTVAILFSGHFSQAQHEFGLGAQLGDPFGLTARYKLSKENSIDGAIGTGSHDDLNIHADYLWHHYKLFRLGRAWFDAYFGPGVRMRDREKDNCRKNVNCNDDDDDGIAIGPRGVGGLMFDFKNPRVELFVELAAVLELVPDSDGDVDFSTGGRYFF